MQGQGSGYLSVVQGDKENVFGSKRCLLVVLSSNSQSPVSEKTRQLCLQPGNTHPHELALNPGSSGTPRAFVHCHANSCLETIPALFYHLSNAHFVPYQLCCIQNPAASGFSSCISDTRRKCCCEYNGKKQIMITKARAQGILSGSRLG